MNKKCSVLGAEEITPLRGKKSLFFVKYSIVIPFVFFINERIAMKSKISFQLHHCANSSLTIFNVTF